MKLDAKPLHLECDEKGQLFLDGKALKPDIRTFGQMKKVMFQSEPGLPNTPTYFMYRDVVPELKKNSIRYDVTVILPTPLGQEKNKTLGHYHPEAVPGFSYTELYNVLSGEAHYLLQKKSTLGKLEDIIQLEEAILIKAKAGDAVVMPPNYGHITINPGPDMLVMANLVEANFSSDYHEYVEHRGGAYYEFANGKIIFNPTYGSVPKLKLEKGTCESKFRPNILAAYYKKPENFEFLKDPRKCK
jgi:glucose-6-phosphate isomerase